MISPCESLEAFESKLLTLPSERVILKRFESNSEEKIQHLSILSQRAKDYLGT